MRLAKQKQAPFYYLKTR